MTTNTSYKIYNYEKLMRVTSHLTYLPGYLSTFDAIFVQSIPVGFEHIVLNTKLATNSSASKDFSPVEQITCGVAL